MTIRASQTTLMGGCGVGYISGFYETNSTHWAERPPLDNVHVGGVGIHCAAFVSTKVCKKTYEDQAKKYKIVYQSPSRRNSNSNRKFIFVVYDRKVSVSEDMNKDFKFPFRPR